MNTNQIDTRIEETFTDPIWQVADNKAWLYSIAYEVSELLDGSMHLLDLGDFCFADHIGEPARDVALDICQNDMLASSYLIQKEGMNNAVYLPDKPKRPRKSTKQRLATMQKDLSLTSPDLDCNDLPGPRPYTPLKNVAMTNGIDTKTDSLAGTVAIMNTSDQGLLTDGKIMLRIDAITKKSLKKQLLVKSFLSKNTPDCLPIWESAKERAQTLCTPIDIRISEKNGLEYITLQIEGREDSFLGTVYANYKKFEFCRVSTRATHIKAIDPLSPIVFYRNEWPVALLMVSDPKRV